MDTPTPIPSQDYTTEDNVVRLASLDDNAERLAVEWLIWLRDVRRCSPHTLKSYNKVMRQWLAWCERSEHGAEPLRPSMDQLEAFMTRKRASTGRKGMPATQALDVAALRGWFKWMHERNRIPDNPSLDLQPPTIRKRVGRPLEDEHWAAMWGMDLPPRLRVSLGLGFYCGLRRHEIGALETSQLTPTRIVRFIRKGGGEDTLPWLQMAEVHALKLPHLLPDQQVLVTAVEHVRNNYDRVVPWINDEQLRRRLAALCQAAGVPNYTPHQLRHSTATNLHRTGMPPHLIMSLMNHSSMDITMGYTRAGEREMREWLDTFSYKDA